MTSLETTNQRAGWHRRALGLFLAAAFLAAGLGGASQARADPVDLAVVDRDTGRPLKVWRHQGRLYVAGRPGSRYALRVTNNTDDRILVVLSVDGVNILSGETAAYGQRGYIFKPHESYDLTGWRKSDYEVAAFIFAPLPQSYAALTGRPGNVGVIGMAVFKERRPPPPAVDAVRPRAELQGGWRGEAPPSPMMAPSPPPPPSRMDRSSSDDAGASEVVVTAQRRQEKLGTGHGDREESVITIEPFERATAYPQFVRRIDYDSRDNLIAIGVIPRRARPEPTPQPFPDRRGRDGYVPDPPGY